LEALFFFFLFSGLLHSLFAANESYCFGIIEAEAINSAYAGRR
jgi:hypothetical protein